MICQVFSLCHCCLRVLKFELCIIFDSRPANVSLVCTSTSPKMFANLSGARFANFSVKVDMSSRMHLLVCVRTLTNIYRVWIPIRYVFNLT